MGYPIYHSAYTAAQIEAAIGKGPRVNASGFWEVWNVGTGAYESTGVGAGVTPPTVVTHVSQMTNHGYIYIYNGTETGYTAGYWYYWDGSAWTAGGAYQVAATDPTLTVAGAAADAKATGDKLGEIKSALTDTEPYLKQAQFLNIAPLKEKISNKYFKNTIGGSTITDLSSSPNWNCYGPYLVKDGDTYFIPQLGTPRVILYDADGVARKEIRNNSTGNTRIECVVEGYTIAYITISCPVAMQTMTCILMETPSGFHRSKYYDVCIEKSAENAYISENLWIPEALTRAEYENKFRTWNIIKLVQKATGAYYNNIIGSSTIYNLLSSANWNSYGFYEVSDGGTYLLAAVTSTPRILLYDSDGIARKEIRNSTGGRPTLIVCSADGYTIKYISVSCNSAVNDSDVCLINANDPRYISAPADYIQKAKAGEFDGVGLYIKNDDEPSANDFFTILDGKTLYALGDSITAGAGNNGVSYATMIANEHNMTFVNKAATGATWVKSMRTPAQGGGYRAWILEKADELVSLSSAPDYILISGGYNDTTGSYDPTTETVIPNPVGTSAGTGYGGTYDTDTVIGCIETALYRLRTAYPNAKLIYVITYPMGQTLQSTYAPAIVECMKKWCIPVVNFCEEGNILNNGAPGNSQLFSDGVHPNALGYSRMSRFVKVKMAGI